MVGHGVEGVGEHLLLASLAHGHEGLEPHHGLQHELHVPPLQPGAEAVLQVPGEQVQVRVLEIVRGLLEHDKEPVEGKRGALLVRVHVPTAVGIVGYGLVIPALVVRPVGRQAIPMHH